MISVVDREKIRRAYFIGKESIRQIARELGYSRKTVRKAIESAEPAAYTSREPRPAPVLEPYKARIEELLAENEGLPRKQRYTGHKIYEQIKAEGYKGSESTVRRHVAQWRGERKRPQVYIPLEFDPATDAQVDWGEAVAKVAGQRITVQMFVMRLCYSRRLFVMAFPSQKQEAFFSGHVEAFRHFQGVPHCLTYDNLTTAVQRVLEGRNRREQEAFIVFRSHHLFASRFCNPGKAHEKGRVEGGVGFARRNFMVPIPEVASFAELNAHLRAACLADDERRGVTRPATLNPYSQVVFETNRYSVPVDEAYRNLVIKAYPFQVDVLYLDRVIASHPRCYDREQDILDPLHYLPLLEQRPGAFDHAQPIRRWREGWSPVYEQLLAHLREQWPDGKGIREFVQILKLHRDHPADQLVLAVGQALEYGCAHADGVKLCLHQLTHPGSPMDPIDLTRWPQLARVEVQPPDLRRYDQLLEQV